jgi:hypothetical protein
MSAIEEVVEQADPALRAHATEAPGPGSEVSGFDFVLTAVHEGYLLHYGESQAFAIDDPDLRLLGGDALYALGLARLAEEGDLPAVAMLADLITGCARAQAEGRPDEAERLWSEASR